MRHEPGSRGGMLVEFFGCPEGSLLQELAAFFGWQPILAYLLPREYFICGLALSINYNIWSLPFCKIGQILFAESGDCQEFLFR